GMLRLVAAAVQGGRVWIALLVAVAQLAPYAVGVLRWAGFGAVGAVGATLLVLGLRYEQRRRDATSVVGWVAALG
ncbi:MAG: hypothetical protein ACRYG2_34970, partial [Janthinobacterium lividum]